MNSSSVVFVFCVLAVASTFGNHDKLHDTKEKCMKQFGVDEEAVKSYMKGETDDPNMRCFGACIMKEMGSMGDDGKVDVDKAVDMVPEKMEHRDELIEIIKTCFPETGADECETAKKIHSCMKEHHKHEKN